MALSAEQRAVRNAVERFAVEEVRPVAAECDREERFPEDVWDDLAELDLTGLTVPEEYGGYDADRLTEAVVNEALAYGSLAVATALSVHSLATACIAEFGDEAVREEWLPEMADGRPVGAFALSEPEAGSNPREMSTVARREGDEYVLEGQKQWITNGARSDVVVVFAKTDPDDPDSITQFLVPKDRDGITAGEPESKLGLRASDTTSLTLESVEVPARYRLTPKGEGLAAALSILTGGRVAIAAQAVGLSQAALDEAVTYVGEREQFDRPIGEIQSVRHRLADMWTTVRAGRLLTRDAARRLDAADRDSTADATDREATDDAVAAASGVGRTSAGPRGAASAAKYFATEGAVDVTEAAVQLHGGYGYVTEFDVERFYRDAKVTTIYEGTTQIQKDVIARDILD